MLKFGAVGFILIFFMAVSSCREAEQKNDGKPFSDIKDPIPFDTEKWLTDDGGSFPYRERMLADLFADDKLKGLTKEQIVERLGQPTRTDKNYFFYLVTQDKIQFFTLRTKTLVIRFSERGLSEAVLIHGG